MSKTLVLVGQVAPPPVFNSNASLLTNISRLAALNPKELLALSVLCMTGELANSSILPLATYNLTTGTNSAVALAARKLVQDSTAYFGNIPTGDLDRAAVAINYANAVLAGTVLSTDVDTLRGLHGMSKLVERPIDELRRMALYLRLELSA